MIAALAHFGGNVTDSSTIPAIETRTSGDTASNINLNMRGASFILRNLTRVNRFVFRANNSWLAGGVLKVGVFQAPNGTDNGSAMKCFEFEHTQSVAANETIIHELENTYELSRGSYHVVVGAKTGAVVNCQMWNTNSQVLLNQNVPTGIRPTTYQWTGVTADNDLPMKIEFADVTSVTSDVGLLHRVWFE